MPMYLAEIAPKQHRGKLVSLSSTAATAGVLVHETLYPSHATLYML